MIFISYPRRRVAIAHLIKLNLELRGYKTFMDLTELQGGDWNEQLRAAIKKATDVVVVVAKDSTPSRAMAAEVEHALHLKKHLVPVIIDEVDHQDCSWVQSSLKYQAVGFDERYPSPSIDALTKLLKTSKGVVSTHETKRLELFQTIIGTTAAAIVAAVAFLTNPSADLHMKKIARGPYAGWELDKDFFYDDHILYSEVYVLGAGGRIPFSTGLFGKVFEREAFNHNLQRMKK